MRKYNKQLPESLSKHDDDSDGGPRCTRPPRLGKFVLDALLEHGKKIWEDHGSKYEKLKSRISNTPNDIDLLRPYEEAKTAFTTPPYSEQLEILTGHVRKCRSDWAGLGRFARTPLGPDAKARAEAKQQQGSVVTNIKKEYAAGPPPESIVDLYSLPRGLRTVKEVKASFAYSLGGKFAFEVAFRDICALKAGANGEEYPVHGRFRDIVVVSSSVARRYNAQRAGEVEST